MTKFFSAIGGAISSLYSKLIYYLEHGDLVLLMVFVSSFHYSKVLGAYDDGIISTLIGVMMDLGHYRTVIVAARYTGNNSKQAAFRWFVAIVMSGVALSYHMRFYNGDWWLASPIPILIIVLAYFNVKDGSAQSAAYVSRHEYKKLQDALAKAKEDAKALQQRLANGKEGFAKLQSEFAKLQKTLAKEQERYARLQESIAELQDDAKAFRAMNATAQAAARKVAGQFATLQEAANAAQVDQSTISRLAKRMNGGAK